MHIDPTTHRKLAKNRDAQDRWTRLFGICILFAFTCILLAQASGCSHQTVQQSDVARADQLLQRTLAAWKAGSSLQDQREQSPPVYVADELWLDGVQLTDYAISGNGRLIGSNVRFQVEMTCATKRGKPRKDSVAYLVTTVPANTVVRLDE